MLRLFNLFVVLVLFSQCKFYMPNYEEPNSKDLSYYGMFNKVDVDSSALKMNSVYFLIDSNNYSYRKCLDNDSCKKYSCIAFIFYDDGLVIYHSLFITDINEIHSLKKKTQGNVFGYYTLKGNEVFFSTVSYYKKTEDFYKAKVYDKYIIVDIENFNTSTGVYEIRAGNIFYLFNNSGQR